MFSNLNKPAFGTGTSTSSFGFGATSTANPTPFGQSQLFGKSTSTSGFGSSAPLFGSTSQQPGSTLFSTTSGSTFGGSPQTGFGTGLFGQQQNTTGGNGLFGANTSGTAFGQQNKTAGFGFGANTATPLFGQQQPQTFQPSTSAGVFGSSAGFGTSSTQMGTVIKFNPVTGTDTMQKSGATHSISTKHHCITCMKEYEGKSLEELRWEDYQCSRRGPQQQNTFVASPFGAPASTAPSLFGQTDNKPAFGQTSAFGTSNGFGLGNQSNQQSLFGKSTNTFGSIQTPNTFGGFSSTTPAFGANTAVKPFGTQPTQNVFGAATSQPSTFGGGSTFFGQTNAQNTNSFFNKPAQTGFSTQQPVFTFGQQTTAQSNLFPPAKTTTGFPSFGQTNLTTNTGFGQPSSNLFGQPNQNPFNAFQKPAQPTFGQPLQTGFGQGTQSISNSFFGNNKPLFGGSTQSSFFMPPSGGFAMPQQQQNAPNQTTSALEIQPQQDFHTIVENMYEPFPYRSLFDGIEVKNCLSRDATNPAVLKKIIEEAPLPFTPPDTGSKMRLFPNSKQSNNNISIPSSGKFSLLENAYSPSSVQDNFLLKSNTGKRLVLKKGSISRTEKDLLEEYKTMSGSDSRNNSSLFKDSVLEEIKTRTPDRTRTVPNKLSPTALLSPISREEKSREENVVEAPTKHDESVVNQSTQTLQDLASESTEYEIQSEPFRTPVSNRYSTLNSDDNLDLSKGSSKTVRFEEENIADVLSTDATASKPNYPCGIKLTRSEYYTIPPFGELHKYQTETGACIVKGFTVGRKGFGNVHFPDPMDIANLDLDEIVHFGYRNVTLYPDDNKKHPIGQGLNRRAQVTLEHVWPRHRVTHELLKNPKDITAEQFIERLALLSEKQNAELVDYRPESGAWVFTVPHFSKYQFTDSDDHDAADELNKSKQQEQKKKEVEKKSIEEKPLEEAGFSELEYSNKGLGGMSMVNGTLPDESLHRSLPQTRMSSVFHEDNRHAHIMKSAFFDEESMSDDVSSSDFGMIHQYSLHSVSVPAPAAIDMRRKSKVPAPKYYSLINPVCATPLDKSIVNPRNYMDLAIFKGKSFRVGWNAGFVIAAPPTRPSSDLSAINAKCSKFVPARVLMLKLSDMSQNPQKMDLEKHLQVAYEESRVVMTHSGIPLMRVKKGFNSLMRHQDVAEQLDQYSDVYISYYTEILNLCIALWGPDADSPTNKRELFSKWLEDVTVPQMEKDLAEDGISVAKKMFILLTAHRVEEAAKLAMSEGFPRLSVLITQASASEQTRMLVQDQVERWKNCNALEHMDEYMIKIYMLLGGIPVILGINVCENLDWKRALAVHLWYMHSPGTSLIHALRLYEHAFAEAGYAAQPNPKHDVANVVVYDLIYQILQLLAFPTTPLEKVINPITYTDDPLDCRLSWMLLQVFTSLKVGTVSEKVADALHVNFASYLEHLGLWKWAIFALLFIKDIAFKKNAIISILERNIMVDRACKENQKIEDSLVKNFKIPAAWIHEVLADRAYLQNRYIEFYQHSCLRKDWTKAHSIAISDIIPEFIATGQCEKLYWLLKRLIPGQHEILHWEERAGLVLDFLDFNFKLEQTKHQMTEYDVKRFKGDILRLCCRVKDFPTNSLKQILAASELSRFIALLLQVLYFETSSRVEDNLQEAVDLIKTLVMPPDYMHDELMKYFNQYLTLNI